MLFSQVSLPDLARISRRSVFGAIVGGVAGLAVCVALGASLVGLGLCVGIGLGIANFRMIQASVAKGATRPGPQRRPLALNTVTRLALITAVALALLFVSFDLGFGVMAGLALFQFLLLFSVIRSILRSGVAAGGFGGGSLLSGIGGMFSVDGLDDDASAPPARPPLEAGDEGRADA